MQMILLNTFVIHLIQIERYRRKDSIHDQLNLAEAMLKHEKRHDFIRRLLSSRVTRNIFWNV